MLTEKDYCDYDTCVALKELGFRERCVAYYDTADNVGLLYNTQYTCDVIPCQYDDLLESRNSATEYEVDAPTLYDAQKWLREEKNVIIVVCPYTYNIVDETHTWTYELWFGDNLEIEIHDFNFYEEALSDCAVVFALLYGVFGSAYIQQYKPKPIDVYRGKTTLEITYRDSVAIDSTVVYKVK